MVNYNGVTNEREGVMHGKVVCATPLRDGQKNRLQERSEPISGASHASRRLLRRWPSILDAVSHSCVTARMPSKRRPTFFNTRKPPPTICPRDLAPWCWKPCDSPGSSCYWKIRRSWVAPQATVVTNTSARSSVAVPVQDVHAASVVPSEIAAHETTAVRASSSNGR